MHSLRKFLKRFACFKTDYEKADLYRQVDLLKNEINEIESKFRQQNYQLTQTMQELNDQKSTSTQIRYESSNSVKIQISSFLNR